MSASDHLNEQQFVNHTELASMYSGDFDEPMGAKTVGAMRSAYREGDEVHPGDAAHGGPDQYIRHLAKDISANGMQEPITVRGGNVVTDGQHRALAAMSLKMDKIPVRHIQ
jgi:hypothetical protein